MITICIDEQTLEYQSDTGKQYRWHISTGKNGIGEQEGSGCTPRGRFRIYSKIGNGAPVNSVFIARQWTGEVYQKALAKKYPNRDWILTRIIQLDGLQHGFNKGGSQDTLKRYIYIHGTPDDTVLGVPGSKGCIRMRNCDLLTLFDTLSLNSLVVIK